MQIFLLMIMYDTCWIIVPVLRTFKKGLLAATRADDGAMS
jgi:hypothetical protein